MATTQRQRRPPATGTVGWVDTCPVTGNDILRITVTLKDGKKVTQNYEVAKVEGGYDLYRIDKDTFEIIHYNIRVDAGGFWWCTCQDARSNFNNCKHVRGLKAALAAAPF